MSDKRIKLSGAAYKKAAKEKLEKTDNLLRKIPKLNSYFAATNPEKTESELKKNSPKKIDKIESCLAGAYEIQSNQIDVQIDNKNAEEATSTNEQQTGIIKSSFHIPVSDPAKWNFDSNSINFLLANPPKLDLHKLSFAETKRIIGNTSRCLTPDNFMRKLQNGEKKIRDWILYSSSKNALFCYQCLLFSPKSTIFGNKDEGFTNWKKCNEVLQEHETSKNHAESVKIWFSRIKKDCNSVIDIELKKDIENQTSYWKNVLHRIVETVTFLASRGLAFRGDNQTFGSKLNGNYLGCLELLAKFDPFLSAHIIKYGNKGKGNVSYLSSTICDEFIMLMSNTILEKL